MTGVGAEDDIPLCERKTVTDFCYLLDKSKQLFNGLRSVSSQLLSILLFICGLVCLPDCLGPILQWPADTLTLSSIFLLSFFLSFFLLSFFLSFFLLSFSCLSHVLLYFFICSFFFHSCFCFNFLSSFFAHALFICFCCFNSWNCFSLILSIICLFVCSFIHFCLGITHEELIWIPRLDFYSRNSHKSRL